jgi:hypothetical protein
MYLLSFHFSGTAFLRKMPCGGIEPRTFSSISPFLFSWWICSTFSTILDLLNLRGIPLVKHQIHLKSEPLYPTNCGLLVVTFRTLVDGHQCFGETHCLHLHGGKMRSRRWIQAFRRNALPPSSGSTRPWGLRMHVIKKHWDPPKILHSTTI